jgi:hypothetical protein
VWTQINSGDIEGLNRHVAIMQQMDQRYAELSVDDLRSAIANERAEIWHYQGQGFEIAMLLRYINARQQWHLANVGFVGNVQPAEALEINLQKGREFFLTHDVSSVVAVRPKAMDYAPLQQYHDLCLSHPDLAITVLNDTEDRTLWELAYTAVPHPVE